MRRRTALVGLIALGLSSLSPTVQTSAVAAQSCPSGATCLYVSSTGSDQNPGTESKPIETLARAQELVRRIDSNMQGNIVVDLEGNGPFRLSRSLALRGEDSGTNGFTIKWTAGVGSSPVISGAVRVSGWSRTNSVLKPKFPVVQARFRRGMAAGDLNQRLYVGMYLSLTVQRH